MNKKAEKKRFPIIKFEWALWFNIIVVIGATISTILVSVYDYNPEFEHIRLFLRINPIIVAVLAVISCVVLLIFRRRVDKLFDTLQAVADGNLVIAVDTKSNDEYGVAYKNLSRVVKELKGSKDEMRQFTDEFMHEFKTPITAIHGFAEYLIATGEGIETPERLKQLQIISDESIRLAELSQKNLMLAKVDACQIITNKIKYDLGEQIKRCIILLLPQIEKKNIELDVDVDGLTYCGDAELMEQVWINLLNNAIKFTPECGEITIKGKMEGEGIILTFADSGLGMDEETQKHIFQKYYQSTSSRQKGGNGIGLSIVHRIVTLCGGNVTVSSKENVGSVFTVFLPR